MNILFASVGALLLLLVAADIVKTTLSSNGGGPITNAAAGAVWRLFFMAARKKAQSPLLDYAGMGVLIAVLFVWLSGLWLGLFLMLLSAADSIVASSTEATTSALEKLYYAGFSLSTLGVGDYKATTDLWRIVTALSAFAGLVLLTTSVTYFVPVLSAVNLQNRIGLFIDSIGRTPQDILKNSWNGKDFSAFTDSSATLANMLMQHILHHHSYPILHYFHNTNPSLSVKLKIVHLLEAYYLLRYCVPPRIIQEDLKLTVLGRVLDTYFDAINGKYVPIQQNEQVPIPDLIALRGEGLPFIDADPMQNFYPEQAREQRSMATSLLKRDGWTWHAVYPNSAT